MSNCSNDETPLNMRPRLVRVLTVVNASKVADDLLETLRPFYLIGLHRGLPAHTFQRRDFCRLAGCHHERLRSLLRYGIFKLTREIQSRRSRRLFTLWDAFRLRLLVTVTDGTDGTPGVYPPSEMMKTLSLALRSASADGLTTIWHFADVSDDVLLGGAEFEIQEGNGGKKVVAHYFAGTSREIKTLLFARRDEAPE